ncbi:MAG TPA: UDP-N-acetylmuramate--alanine ligase [Casimicrobiaceae bacterium]|nr:UDP-N-acetylmuramate--alanine ligase [Casimicrobiaceae bacterium]
MARRSNLAATRDAQNRMRIAQVAARLIADHGIGDWSLAKRKAARELMLSPREALPGDDEIEAALAEHHALFARDTHEGQLRGQREVALRWMRRLAQFAPLLVGGVAAGWATEHSDVRLELVAPDPKAVELALLNAGESYRAMGSDRDGACELYVSDRATGVRLSVRTLEQARQRPRRDRRGQGEIRLTADEVAALLDDSSI